MPDGCTVRTVVQHRVLAKCPSPCWEGDWWCWMCQDSSMQRMMWSRGQGSSFQSNRAAYGSGKVPFPRLRWSGGAEYAKTPAYSVSWKPRYWSVWVGFRYAKILMEPFSPRVRRMSRKGSRPSDSFSTVNCMLKSMLFRWAWNESAKSTRSAAHVLSTYHFQKRGGEWKVDSAFCSMSSITRLATTTDTGDPMAVPRICQ